MNYSGTTMPTKAIPALLALAATVTASFLSILAGWQRGGLLEERMLLTCIGVVLVVAAHLLPALCRPHGWRIRVLGIALWIGCMAATCYGHAVFFVMAQQHAGEARAGIVPLVTAAGRNLAEIASDRAGVVARLARVAEFKCGDRCATVRIERTTLTARLDALDAESAEVARRELAQDRADAERAKAKAGPIAGSLTAFGLAADCVDLVTALAFAAVLEGVACFGWLLALRPAENPARSVTPAHEVSHGLRVMPVTRVSKAVAPGGPHHSCPDHAISLPTSGQEKDVARVLTAISDGTLRGTVMEIRKHLGCSQAKAAAVRKQLAQYTHPVV